MHGLSPFALTTFAEAAAYLQRFEGAEESARDTIVRSVNAATGWLEERTRRRLAARTYRTAVMIACTGAADDATLTGSGFSDNVLALDEVVGHVALELGVRVASVPSDTALELTEPLKAAISSAADLSFGSEPLKQSGYGENTIYVEERPLRQVYRVAALETDGTETELDLTGINIMPEVGLIVLPSDVAPRGDANILIECLAGYRAPSALARGDWAEWEDLKHACHRLAQIFFQDEANQPGRLVSQTVSQMSGSLPDFRVPDDVLEIAAKYMRRW